MPDECGPPRGACRRIAGIAKTKSSVHRSSDQTEKLLSRSLLSLSSSSIRRAAACGARSRRAALRRGRLPPIGFEEPEPPDRLRRAGAPLKTARTAQPTIGKHIANPNHTDIPKRGSLKSFSPRRERHFRVNTRSAVRENGLSDTSRTALHDTRRCRPHPRLTNRNCRRGYFRAVRRDCRASSPPKRSSSEVRT